MCPNYNIIIKIIRVEKRWFRCQRKKTLIEILITQGGKFKKNKGQVSGKTALYRNDKFKFKFRLFAPQTGVSYGKCEKIKRRSFCTT